MRLLGFCVGVILLLFNKAIIAQPAPSDKSNNLFSGAPSGLMVEFIREPKSTLINDSLPEYCWIVPEDAKIQKAWQILVASTKNLIDKNIGDVWNSSQVKSYRSSSIEHGGNALKPTTTYYWKVKIWDKDNKISKYSKEQQFKTGNFRGTVSSSNSFQTYKVAPSDFRKTTSNSYFIDFGKDAFGNLELNYKTVHPETLTVRLGEKLLEGKIDRNPGGTIRYTEVKFPVVPLKSDYLLNLTADKRNTSGDAVLLPDSFGLVTPFRYCELENVTQPLKSGDVRQKVWNHFFDDGQSSFTSSDTVLNQVWELCKYSIKATSFTGLYIDGDRERIPYEADAYINQLSHYGVDREYAMARQTIEYFMSHPTWPTEWLLHTALMVYQDYNYTGDTELIKKYYEQLKQKSLIALSREDGLIGLKNTKIDGRFMQSLGFADSTKRLNDIVDWPAGSLTSGVKSYLQKGERDGYDMVPINTVVNSFFFRNMQILAEFAGLLGKSNDQREFLVLASKVRKSINEKLFDQNSGVYLDGEGSKHSSLHANMLPLAFGIVPDIHQKTVTDFIKSRGMACSVYGAQYLLEGLYLAGEEQYALDLMRATSDRSWWNMIRVGSTIAMEAWDMKYKPNADWNHAWGAVPGNIIPRFMWGITPKIPGFERIEIKPQMGNLKSSTITIPTIKGSITGSYKLINDQQQKFEIELPANVSGEFILKNSKNMVTVNGQLVPTSNESILLEPGMNRIEISSNSH